jgi:hypothetical protein
MDELPEPPELPDDLAEELARSQSKLDAHGESLKAWTAMAAQFYDALVSEFGDRIADRMILQWQRIWFESLYAGLLDQPPEME